MDDSVASLVNDALRALDNGNRVSAYLGFMSDELPLRNMEVTGSVIKLESSFGTHHIRPDQLLGIRVRQARADRD